MNPNIFDVARGEHMSPPPRARGDCRLLIVQRSTGAVAFGHISDLEWFVDGEVWANDSYADRQPDMNWHPIYAKKPGSWASPTAGLPFDQTLADELEIKFLTMHISSPSNQEDIQAGFATNVGWKEWYSIPIAPNGKIMAIGTSVLKATETFAKTGELTGYSQLFVQPPFDFKIVNKFLTSFYFPGSPLVAMTCAFGGTELIKEAYAKAVEKKFWFGIFGDRILVI